eukprot:m.805183 g.805183  ORF g.805183 m.805183 type:complete len:800 (+) comp23371_c0_seq9:1289-3688(+)
MLWKLFIFQSFRWDIKYCIVVHVLMFMCTDSAKMHTSMHTDRARLSKYAVFTSRTSQAGCSPLSDSLPTCARHQAVDNILCDDEFVFFAWRNHVYAYSHRHDRVISRFGSFPKYGGDGDGADDTTSVTSLAARRITLQCNRTWIVVAWGSRLILCDRTQFAQQPFRVVHQFELSSMIRRVSFIANFIVVCSVTGTVSFPHDAPDASAEVVPSAGTVEGPGSTRGGILLTEAPEMHLLSPDGSERGERVVLPAAAGRVVAAPFSHAQLAGDAASGRNAHGDGTWGGAATGGFISGSFVLGGGGGPTEATNRITSIATHCFFLCPRHVYILRVLTSAELILELVKQQQFPLAMHLCQQKFRRPQVFMEVAGMHANALWKMGRCEEAVRVWGEVHLPSAPALYWSAFIDRLEAAGRIDLAVKWLPFNDRTKVGHDVYERILLSTVDAGDYLTVLARVSRWPVLYKFDPVVAKVTQLLVALIFAPADPPAPCTDAGGDTAAAPEATAAAVDVGVSDVRVPLEDGGEAGESGAADGTPGGAGSSTAPAVDAEESHRIEIAFVLLVTLFKLYEFGSRFVEAAQILIRLDALRLHHAASESTLPLVNLDTWTGDDESYTYALHTTLKTIGGLRSHQYFDSKRLWGLLLPPRASRPAPTATSPDSPASSTRAADAMAAITRSGAHDVVVLGRRELEQRGALHPVCGAADDHAPGCPSDDARNGDVCAELTRVLVATGGAQHVVKMLAAEVLMRLKGEPGIDADAERLLRACNVEEEYISILRATAQGHIRAPLSPSAAVLSPPRGQR